MSGGDIIGSCPTLACNDAGATVVPLDGLGKAERTGQGMYIDGNGAMSTRWSENDLAIIYSNVLGPLLKIQD